MDVRIPKGFSLYLTLQEHQELRSGQHTAEYIVGYVVAKLKPVFEPTNLPKGSGKPSEIPVVKEVKKKDA